ncbi:MAG TPA: ankyrin repeat domain-containing protein [Gemmatimonadales bacterium]|nr:ankyrin repeat domain-containing protein [Gemmatimonadales bacterium]
MVLSGSLGFGVGSGEAPVADAAQRNDVEAVRALVRQGAAVNAAQGDGMTALHWAAVNGNGEMTQVLLRAGAQVGAVTRLGGYTPLHLASKDGHASVIEALLKAGAQVDLRTTAGGVTPLHFAAQAGRGDAIALLLKAGADPNARETTWEQTPLMFAAARDRVEAVRTLLAGGADISLTAKVLDLVARDRADRADEQRRSREIAALRGTAEPAPRYGQQATGAPAQGAQRGQEQPGQAPPEGLDALSYSGLVGHYGGLSALLLAVREGHVQATLALLDGGADINQSSAGDQTAPLLMATINGHFDLARMLLERGADPNGASASGIAPLYATLNTYWSPKSRHPQPVHYTQQQTTYLELAESLLRAGADPNARLKMSPWFDTYGDDYLGVDRMGATPFWRAAYATDVPAMRLLVAHGADPSIPTMKPPEGRRRGRGGQDVDHSGLPPVPVGGPGTWPIHAAAGVGYGEGYAGNVHRHVPDGWLPAMKYLVEELGADVNARDLNGFAPLHHAAARGDNEMILYLVSKGADVTAVARRGQTTADMANGPVQRISPFPETVALLERLGSNNNHNCVSC